MLLGVVQRGHRSLLQTGKFPYIYPFCPRLIAALQGPLIVAASTIILRKCNVVDSGRSLLCGGD